MEIQQSCALTTLPPASPLQRRPVCGKEGNVGYHPTHRRLESYNMKINKYRKIHFQMNIIFFLPSGVGTFYNLVRTSKLGPDYLVKLEQNLLSPIAFII